MSKRFLLSLLVASTAATAFAQPTLTTTTNNPVIGDRFVGYTIDTAGLTMGASGASATWNYASVVVVDNDTISYVSCPSTPYCDSFSGSNIVQISGAGGDYTYGVSVPTGIKMIGAYSMGSYVHIPDSLTYTRFPLSYGTTFSDTFNTMFTFSGLDIYITQTTASDCDAWGTLILPSGTFANTLRVHTTLISKDSVEVIPGFPQVNISQTESYSWYVSGFHSPLLTIDYDTAGATPPTPYPAGAKYYITAPPPPSTGISTVAGQSRTLSIYPNPANNDINMWFTATGTAPATIAITDMTGKVVYATNLSNVKAGINEIKVPVNNLPNGMYMARLQGAGILAVEKFTIVK